MSILDKSLPQSHQEIGYAVCGCCPVTQRALWFVGFDCRGPMMFTTAWKVRALSKSIANSVRRYLQRSQTLSRRRRTKFAVVDLVTEERLEAALTPGVLDSILDQFPVMERIEQDDAGDLYAAAERASEWEVA